jgi:hypothetical protein
MLHLGQISANPTFGGVCLKLVTVFQLVEDMPSTVIAFFQMHFVPAPLPLLLPVGGVFSLLACFELATNAFMHSNIPSIVVLFDVAITLS